MENLKPIIIGLNLYPNYRADGLEQLCLLVLAQLQPDGQPLALLVADLKRLETKL